MTGKAIVVGYDGSTGGRAALHWALDEARLRRSPVRLVYAAPAPDQLISRLGGYVLPDLAARREAGRVILAAGTTAAAEFAPDVAVETRLADTTPTVALLSGSADSEMIVVGSRGLGGFSDLLVGSTSVQLATHASCPVVVIRPHETEVSSTPGVDTGRIIVGVDGSDVSSDALGFAFEEAAMRGLGLTAVHAWQSAYFDGPGKGPALPGSIVAREFQASEMRVLVESIALWTAKLPSVSLAQRVVHGDPVTTLVEASAGAELLIVGSRGRDGFRSLLLGSVSHAVLHHAHCPVTVVRHRT